MPSSFFVIRFDSCHPLTPHRPTLFPPYSLPSYLPPFTLDCSAPRRRYAKKVGDKWGVTNDGGDFPIYFLTFAGLAAVTYFTLIVVPTL